MLHRGRFATRLFLFLILLSPCAASAGIGMAISEPAIVDTKSPLLQVDPVPDMRLIAGQQYTFHWTVDEAHPGQSPDDFRARVLMEETVVTEIDWLEHPTEYSWVWTVPEIQSGQVRLEVVVKDLLGNSSRHLSNDFIVLMSTTEAPDLPGRLHLSAPYPNPFNPACSLEFDLPVASPATVAVFDARGHRIRELWQGEAPAGTTRLQWKGTDQNGRPQPAGVYFFVLQTPGQPRQVTRAVLIP